MKKEELTPYDKYVISKNKSIPDLGNLEQKQESRKEEASRMSSSYEDYLKMQLRRTKPSAERVMTMEEFEKYDSNEKMKTGMWERLGGQTEGATEHKGRPFKKSGKILFAAYVIILLCLALIVIVKTTTVNIANSIDAAEASDREVQSSIETMEDEESETSGGWFDKFCDSRK